METIIMETGATTTAMGMVIGETGTEEVILTKDPGSRHLKTIHR